MNRLPACTVQGSGSTAVLLLHGIGGGRAIWSDEHSGTASALAAAGYCVVALDFPGYGDSLSLGAPHLDAMVAATRVLVADIASPRVVLLGHSMGGMVAQELLARDAGRVQGKVQGLVLACTSASFGKPDGDWQAKFVADRLAPLDAGLGMAAMADRLVPGLLAPKASAAAAASARAVMSRVPEVTYRAALQAIVGFDRREALAHINVPTLMLAAEHDRTAPAEVMQRMADRVSGAAFVSLAGAGHLANVEVPSAFHAAVLAFLQRLPDLH